MYSFFKTKGHERNYLYTVEDTEHWSWWKNPFPPNWFTTRYDSFDQGVTKERCRLSWLTNRPSYMNPNAGGGVSCGVSASEYSCAQCTWSPNKLGRSNSIFNLWFLTLLTSLNKSLWQKQLYFVVRARKGWWVLLIEIWIVERYKLDQIKGSIYAWIWI